MPKRTNSLDGPISLVDGAPMLRCDVALAVIRVQERRVIFAEPVGCCYVLIEVVEGSFCVDVVQAKRVQPVP